MGEEGREEVSKFKKNIHHYLYINSNQYLKPIPYPKDLLSIILNVFLDFLSEANLLTTLSVRPQVRFVLKIAALLYLICYQTPGPTDQAAG